MRTCFLTLIFLSLQLAGFGQIDYPSKAYQGEQIAIYFPVPVSNGLPLVHFPHQVISAEYVQNDTIYCKVPFGAGYGPISISYQDKIYHGHKKFSPWYASFEWKAGPNYTELFSLAYQYPFSKPLIADFNLDGLPDIALPNTAGAELHSPLGILLNTSQNFKINFEIHHVVIPDSLTFSISRGLASDIDADGDIDILVANQKELVILRNMILESGVLSFNWEPVFAFDLNITGMEICDIDLNGISEIFISTPDDLHLLHVNNWKNPQIQIQHFNLPAQIYYELTCTDLDIDGFMDIAIGYDLGLLVLKGNSFLADTSAFPLHERIWHQDGIPRHYLYVDEVTNEAFPYLLTRKSLDLERHFFTKDSLADSLFHQILPFSYYFTPVFFADLNYDSLPDALDTHPRYPTAASSILNWTDTGKFMRQHVKTTLPQGFDFQDWCLLPADLNSDGYSELVVFSFAKNFKTIQVYQLWNDALKQSMLNEFNHLKCNEDSIFIGDTAEIRWWSDLADTADILSRGFWVTSPIDTGFKSYPNQALDSTNAIWNGRFEMADSLGSANVHVVVGNPGYMQILEEDMGKIIWSQKLDVKPYSRYRFSFRYSTMAFAQTQTIPIQIYINSGQWSPVMPLKGLRNQTVAYEFTTGDTNQIELVIYFQSYGTFFPLPKPQVNFAVTDLQCIQFAWQTRTDSVLHRIESHPKPQIEQIKNRLIAKNHFTHSALSWFKNGMYLGNWSEIEIDTADTSLYVLCAKTINFCESCSDSLKPAYWNPSSLHEVQKLGIYVFPNPTEDLLHVQTKIPCTIKFYTMQGVLLLYVPENLNHTLNLSEFPPGLYYLQCEQGDFRFSHKVIVQ